jgi:diguanylate cyclase (GGDEF)-like protein
MADLDHFKRVNDSYGHQAGDAVLQESASRILSLMRPYDAAGRYGGEEFLFVLPDCNQEKIAVMAERIRSIIEGDRMNAPEGMIPVTISLGVAVSGAGEADAAALVCAADLALYRAKGKGRNRVEFGRVERV